MIGPRMICFCEMRDLARNAEEWFGNPFGVDRRSDHFSSAFEEVEKKFKTHSN